MLFDKFARILVVAAHPDDEVLGCGGILARAVQRGIPVSVIFLGEGISARFDPSEFHNDTYNEAERVRNEGTHKAMKVLGIDDFELGENYCCRFDTVPTISLTKRIEKKIASFEPTCILTHNPVEVNIDHRITFRAVEAATRPSVTSSVRGVFGFEIPCSGNWSFEEAFKPNFYVDIEDVWDIKLAAWNCYVGEERPFPFPRSNEGLRTLAQFRGMQSGRKVAEGLRVFRFIED